MDDWQKEFFGMLDLITGEVEKFVHEINQDVNEFIETLAEVSEEVAQQLQEAIATEFDEYLNPLFDAFIEDFPELSDQTWEFTYPGVETVEPSLTQNPACRGCRHYHGQVYNGNLLVCGMYPYGWEGETCPDWEAEV